MSQTSTEQQAATIRKGLAELAATRARILIGKGRVVDAVDAMKDIAQQYTELLDILLHDPTNTPIEFCGFPRRLCEILQGHDYKTIGDLHADWPGRLLSKPNLEVYGHYMVGRALTKFGLLPAFRPTEYADMPKEKK